MNLSIYDITPEARALLVIAVAEAEERISQYVGRVQRLNTRVSAKRSELVSLRSKLNLAKQTRVEAAQELRDLLNALPLKE
jgi:chromosome segregation ATPase